MLLLYQLSSVLKMAEQVNPFESRNAVEDDEFDNFMLKVQEVRKLMDGLTSNDKSVASEALKLVDNYLGTTEKTFNEDSLKVKTNKTVINQKAFDSMKKEGQQETQSPEDFMKSCEADAKRRAEERRLQKEASDTLKKRAIAAFNQGEYEKALSFYNKAINEFRCRTHLYNSRALTCLKLKLYEKTIEDCDLVLRCFDEKNFKALLYKAKAHKALGEEEEAGKCVQQAITFHPKSKDVICEYINENPTDDK